MNKKYIILIFIALFLLVFVPMYLLLPYVHPSTDDFGPMNHMNELGYFGTVWYYYTHWLGRYTAFATISAYPLIFKSFIGYKILPGLMLTTVIFSFWKLGRSLFEERQHALIFAISLLGIYFYKMPNLAECIYWWNGSIPYQLSNVLMIFLLMRLIRNFQTGLALNSLLVVLIIGCNETSMAVLVLLLGFLNLVNWLPERKIHRQLIVLSLVSLLAAAVVILAPGNAVRGSHFANAHQLMPSVKNSLGEFLRYLNQWLLFTPLIPLSILCLGLLPGLNQLPDRIFRAPLWMTLGFWIFLLMFTYFPAYYSMGNRPPARTVNITWFIFLAGWFYHLFRLHREHGLSFRLHPVIRICMVLMCVFMVRLPNNVLTAWNDLRSGEAAQYSRELENRYRLVKNATGDTCVIPALKAQPESIMQQDLFKENALEVEKQVNHGFAVYFKKKYVIVKDSE